MKPLHIAMAFLLLTMKISIAFGLLILCCLEGLGQTPDSLIRFYNALADKFLIKNPRVRQYFSIDNKGISLYPSPQRKAQDKPEMVLLWKDLSVFVDLIQYGDRRFQFDAYQKWGTKGLSTELAHTIFIIKQNYRPRFTTQTLPLSGIRVAIDPGHIAGDLATAKTEGRFVSMTANGKKLEFFEAELALSTAFVLRDSLLKYGAEVMLTRTQGNQTAFGKSYQQWLETDFRLILKRKGYTPTQINNQIKTLNRSVSLYSYFLDADLEARADKINYFNPDITVILHFNADYYNFGWKKPTTRNYSMVFVPGSFLGGELYSREMRFDFLRLMLSAKTARSLILSRHIVDEFEKVLQVKPVSPAEEPPYLKENSLRVADGVYARNLRLNRLVNSVLCYGEPLLQDNEQEAIALAANDLNSGKISPRIIQTAQAYFNGIMRYVVEMKKTRP